MAGAEIIEHEPHPDIADRAEGQQPVKVEIGQRFLAELEFEPLRRESALLERGGELGEQRALPQLAGRDVDRKRGRY